MSRDYTPKGSIFRELGDFISHPEEKNRGLVLNSVEAIAEDFDAYIKNGSNLEDRLALKPFEGIGTRDEIFSSLKDTFALANLETRSFVLRSPEFRDFIFSLIFLLSNSKLKFRGALYPFEVEYEHSVKLNVKYISQKFPNVGATLGVLSLRNVWIDFCGWESHILKNHIARRLDDGNLAAISYEKDLKTNSNLKFQAGETWPLPPIEGKYA
jgi:hypothetical protein